MDIQGIINTIIENNIFIKKYQVKEVGGCISLTYKKGIYGKLKMIKTTPRAKPKTEQVMAEFKVFKFLVSKYFAMALPRADKRINISKQLVKFSDEEPLEINNNLIPIISTAIEQKANIIKIMG